MRVLILESSEYSSTQEVKSSIISGKDFKDDMHGMICVPIPEKTFLAISCRNREKNSFSYLQSNREQKPLAGGGWKEGKLIFLSLATLQNLIVKKLKMHLYLIATIGQQQFSLVTKCSEYLSQQHNKQKLLQNHLPLPFAEKLYSSICDLFCYRQNLCAIKVWLKSSNICVTD